MRERVAVLVVGAGLAGSAAAMFLARRGVEVLLVERRSAISPFPRAIGQNQRTMELLGFGGIAGEVPQATERLARFRVRVAATVPGPALHEEVSSEDGGAIGALSPAGLGAAGQHELEPMLLRRAEKLGAEIHFGTELVSFEQDDDGVTALLRHDGRTTRVRAAYLVAADGNRSDVRAALGVERHGPGSLSHHISIIFDADLGRLVDPEHPTLHILHNEHLGGVFTTIDHAADRHLLTTGYDPAAGQTPPDFTTERCVDLIRLVTELPGLEPRIAAVRPWEMAAAVADRFLVGRVLLAGDAAKVTPPSGGLGGNTAIGDAYDLAWKLAAVLDGTAGPRLLETYDAERRPIAERVVAEALRLLAERGSASDANAERQRALELTLGFRYRSAAIRTDDDDPADTEDPFHPSGRPGFRAPHVWLRHETLSTIDLFGDGFVLLTGAGNLWSEAAAGLEAAVRIHPIGAEPGGEFFARYGIGPSGASLVRPDGVIAWRVFEAPSDPKQALSDTLATVSAR
ncbi:aklavinone 12-hydroxylase RdmE [Nocardia pseudobrasiliensis]|uniref:Aklavinone 12-hydroxylase n=1 Tax=Nocardia pseudobrasiliensis TaxID=45979 RepID=A0A370I4A3_9NOCA|nr:FAD-dependent oxidoreductase [Nocardia pseudobrasiliensis]RDI65549.1 aklavinone 12-hydroxylase [Nocardia pseudobrasiliensis]